MKVITVLATLLLTLFFAGQGLDDLLDFLPLALGIAVVFVLKAGAELSEEQPERPRHRPTRLRHNF